MWGCALALEEAEGLALGLEEAEGLALACGAGHVGWAAEEAGGLEHRQQGWESPGDLVGSVLTVVVLGLLQRCGCSRRRGTPLAGPSTIRE